MGYAGRRPTGRLCCWVLMAGMVCGFRVLAWGAAPGPQSGPAMTTVADTVYRADGTAAQGTMIITWPAFVSASGTAVAAGVSNVAIGANGGFSVALVSNAGANPAGVYYTVVYQLGPGEVKTEFWSVPTASPANLATVRATPGSGVAGQGVSMQYVNTALATKADDSSVVHVNGTETISGTKTFANAPNVPAPTSSGQVASKGYVDQSVANVGAGNYLPTAGGTMTGPLTLPGSPAAALQATTKQYVDTGLASKSDLISGLVPVSELGAGQASANNCLLGNGTWAPCAAGGTGNLSTTPVASQTIAQPAGTQFATNNLANIRYVTSSWNWAQTPADNLATPGNVAIHLSPCPLGIDTASSTNYYTYKVYISGAGTAEAVAVTGGSCTPGASSGTITVKTAYAHAAGYTVGSASTGIQEAWNDAWTNDIPHDATNTAAPYVKLTADSNYRVYASVYLRGKGGILDGAGAFIACSTRDRCIFVGTTQPGPATHYHKLYNLTGGSTVNVDGVQVASVSASSGTYTITTASVHSFVVGDTVDCEYHSQTNDQHWASPVVSVPTASSFTVAFGNGSFAAGANTFGFCNILNAFIEDNSNKVVIQDINLTQLAPTLAMGFFSYGIVNDNDQQFIIERAGNRSSMVIQSTANWPIGAFLYQRTDQGAAGITYLHNSEFTNINCGNAGGNGFVVTNTVCQGFPLFGFRYFGGLQPSTFENVYEESTGGTMNPLYGSLPAQMGMLVQGGTGHRIVGTFPVAGYAPTFASGGGNAAERTYFVVPRSSTMGYGPVLFIGLAQPTSSSTNISLQWPSIALQDGNTHGSLGTLTWDILVATGTSATSPAPYGTGTYALATNISGSCNTGGICSYTDTQPGLTQYTVQAQQYYPAFWFWPANLAINNTVVFQDVLASNPAVVASQGITSVSVVAAHCTQLNAAYLRSPVQVTCETINNTYQATVLGTLGGLPANSKGRLNLGAYPNPPNDLITLYDSNFGKTAATAGARPAADAGDTTIGMDQTGGLSERAGTSITSYINALPSGTNYLERLTASGKTFNVPLTVNGGLAVSGGNVTLPVTGPGSQCLHVSTTGVVSGTGADCGSGGSSSGTVNTGSASQVAMYSGGGTAVSGDTVLTDNGTTLNYMGSGGLATTTGTFSGNLTVNGQLRVAGPWSVTSPVPGTQMGAAGAGTSALGISNDGNFYISTNGGTPQQVATSATSSYFPNLWQEDANTLGAYNGTNPQALHVYGTYGSASSYERTGLGWDANGLFVVRNENAGTGQQRPLGFSIGSTVRWMLDTASAFKPFQNNSFDIGTVTSVPRTVYAGTSFDSLTQGRLNFELCNDLTTGTALNFLAKYNGATPACAVKAGMSDMDGVIGVVSNGWGITGNAVITYRGYAQCSFDGGTTAGDYVVASTTNPGDCHDPLTTGRPTGVQVLGRVESTNAGAGTYGVRVSLDAPGGTGAPVTSPTFTGTVTLPDGTTDSAGGLTLGTAVALPGGSTAATQSTADSSTKVATTAYVQNQKYMTNTGRFIDAALQSGATLDVRLNNANALAITSGNSTIDARAMGGTQTLASEVSIGELRPPAVSAVSGTSPGAGTYNVVYTLTSPTASETSASMESTVTVTGAQAIQVASPTYYGTATSYSVYMTAAAGASWTEKKCASATGVAIGTAVTITASCSGAAVSLANSNFGVALVPPQTGAWNVSITDGVSCGLRFFDQSSFLGSGSGAGRPWSVVSASSATNVEGLICTDNNPKQNSGYYNLVGLSAHDVAGDTMHTAVIVIQNTYDTSAFVGLHAGANTAVPALWVWGTCCATYFSGAELGGNGIGEPLKIGMVGTGTYGTNFHDTSAGNPGPNLPTIEIAQAVRGLTFSGTTYMEGSTPGPCADAIQIATAAGVLGPVSFDNVTYGGIACSGSSSYIFDVGVNSNTVNQFSVRSIQTGTLTNVFRYPANTALNISGVGTNSVYPEITLDINSPKTVLTNFQVLGATALGTATAITPGNSDNSTNVATTAFVKGQGYAGLASPVLTGTPTAPTASAGDNSMKIATTAYVKNEAQFAWTCPVAGSTAVTQNCNWTLPAGLTIMGFDFAANTAAVGCTTYPTVQVWDGTAGAEVGSYSITLSSGNNFPAQVVGSTNIAAGHWLRIKVTTAAAGCTTYPLGMVATVTYQMQN